MLCYRWNRLENLLVQGKKDRDFSAKDALQPVLKLLLGPDGEELRALVIKESVRVSEAVILGSMLDTYNSVPSPMRTLIFNGNATGPLMMSDAEQNSLMELRAQVFRIWGLLRESDNFDPSLLQPLLQVRDQLFKFLSLFIPFMYLQIYNFGWTLSCITLEVRVDSSAFLFVR